MSRNYHTHGTCAWSQVLHVSHHVLCALSCPTCAVMCYMPCHVCTLPYMPISLMSHVALHPHCPLHRSHRMLSSCDARTSSLVPCHSLTLCLRSKHRPPLWPGSWVVLPGSRSPTQGTCFLSALSPTPRAEFRCSAVLSTFAWHSGGGPSH